eukprot:gnl/Dysnectes_brevis/384_a426_2994.p1 GENE.gnl/Dysnectes_brevis/384_a426_2994~~gnl/Dysnectes_brevis/384_a426_2994.p1  ORF type:complete len:549 (-),score=222.11 gnl/Dysnectes_brevis/384_a426_2994:633-2063(-)
MDDDDIGESIPVPHDLLEMADQGGRVEDRHIKSQIVQIPALRQPDTLPLPYIPMGTDGVLSSMSHRTIAPGPRNHRSRRVQDPPALLLERMQPQVEATISTLSDRGISSEIVREVVWRLQQVVSAVLPEAKVAPYGGAISRLSLTSGDVDLTLLLPREYTEEEKGEMLGNISVAATKAGAILVHEALTARIPVIRLAHELADPATGEVTVVESDLTVNNRLGVRNTLLLHEYMCADPRARPLVLMVKHWAKRRGVNSSFMGTLSSYGFVILIIFYLQQLQQPVLPSLQPGLHPAPVMGFDTGFLTAGQGWNRAKRVAGRAGRSLTQNKDSMAKLLFGFFRFYAYEFDFGTSVISIRLGRALSREEKGWPFTARVSLEAVGDADSSLFDPLARYLLCIEDPFEHCMNVGRTVGWDGYKLVGLEFRRACCVLKRPGKGMERLCLSFQEDPPGSKGEERKPVEIRFDRPIFTKLIFGDQ